jgi:hypothetical protein
LYNISKNSIADRIITYILHRESAWIADAKVWQVFEK